MILDEIKDYIKESKNRTQTIKDGSTNTVEVILKLDNQEINTTKFSIV